MKKTMFAFIQCMLLLGCGFSFVEVPGETRNSPEIANFAAKQIFSSLRYEAPGCYDGKVLNTVFNRYTSTKNKNSWQETWTVDMCGKRFEARVDFYTMDGRPETTTVGIDGKGLKQLN